MIAANRLLIVMSLIITFSACQSKTSSPEIKALDTKALIVEDPLNTNKLSPFISNKNILLLINTPIILDQLLVSDLTEDKELLTIQRFNQGLKGGLVEWTDTNALKYTPALNYSGYDSFTYEVADDQGASATVKVNITIEKISSISLLTGETITIQEDEEIILKSLVNNVFNHPNDTNSIRRFQQANHGEVTLRGDHVLKYTPKADYHGMDNFSYITVNDEGHLITGIINILIEPTNDPPLALDDVVITREDENLVLPHLLNNDLDKDADDLVLSAFTQSDNGGLVELVKKNVLRYTPPSDFNGEDRFSYTVSDGNNGEASANVTIYIQATNDTPLAKPDSFIVTQSQTNEISLTANDRGLGDQTQISIISAPQQGNLKLLANGNATYTPKKNYFGHDSFVYQITDSDGETSIATASLTVECFNNCDHTLTLPWNWNNNTDVIGCNIYFGTDASTLNRGAHLGKINKQDAVYNLSETVFDIS